MPLLAVLISSANWHVPVIGVAVILALVLTGVLSARLGGMGPGRQVARNVIGGVLAMVVTYGIGSLVGGRV